MHIGFGLPMGVVGFALGQGFAGFDCAVRWKAHIFGLFSFTFPYWWGLMAVQGQEPARGPL